MSARRTEYHDALTGLPSRVLLHEHLRKEVAHASRGRGLLGLALLDLDAFQNVNSSLGTRAGDRLLQSVARRLSQCVRESDTLARYGDDEFAVILTNARQSADLLYAANRLQQVFERPFRVGAERLSISCCLGIGVAPAGGVTASELLSRAASALSQAKKSGHGSIEVFESSVRGPLREKMRAAEDLRRAFREHELLVHYQPQIDLGSGRIVGAEGLVRWNHPKRGLVSAGEIIPLAEEIGIMPELGGWLLRELCAQNARWRERGRDPIPLAVNVSIRQFQAGGVASAVRRVLDEHQLDASSLHLEITESIALHDVERMRCALGEIRKMGVQIHLDDFGTGYSSLSYLLKFPVDVIKIDGSFVAELLESEQSRAIVEATLALAAALDLPVIAECVETSDQLRCLAEMGCSAAQGYLIAKPLAPEKFEEILAEGTLPLPGLRGE